jgi:hypothetical protein
MIGMSILMMCAGIGWFIYRCCATRRTPTGRVKGITFEFITVKLARENLEDAVFPLPYGAKLKALEAQKTQIFTRLEILYPQVTNDDLAIRLPDFPMDPAIVGHAMDDRRYMIVYWDVKNDIEKSTVKLRKLKKFKLKV